MLTLTFLLTILIQTPSGHTAPPARPVAVSEHPWPCRLGMPVKLVPQFEELWESSPTFRRQCARIAEADVTVAVGVTPVLSPKARALSRIMRRNGRVFYASVILSQPIFLSEDVPHELEHILEQIEGQNLAAEVRAGRATWVGALDAYETDRARNAGRRARREIADARSGAAPRGILAQEGAGPRAVTPEP
jgi:hypothetical protein